MTESRRPPRCVRVDGYADAGAAAGRDDGVDHIELADVVDHERHARGGGLIAGMAVWWAGRVKVVGVEPEGSRALHAALEAGVVEMYSPDEDLESVFKYLVAR